jgi:hypothetical protein
MAFVLVERTSYDVVDLSSREREQAEIVIREGRRIAENGREIREVVLAKNHQYLHV